MTTQLDLEIEDPAPKISEEEIERLCEYLRGRGWVKSPQIEADIKMKERIVRRAAEFSDGRILSGPGCPGYKLFTGAIEIDEADLCATRIESQAKKMIHRAAAIRRRYHRYAHPAAITNA